MMYARSNKETDGRPFQSESFAFMGYRWTGGEDLSGVTHVDEMATRMQQCARCDVDSRDPCEFLAWH